MPLRIELAPNERLIIGDVSLRNGPRRSEFVIETKTKVLRERDIIRESEADTPCKRLYFVLEAGYLSNDALSAERSFMALANEIMAAAPSAAPLIAEVFDCVLAGDYYLALKRSKRLLAFEADLLKPSESMGEGAPEAMKGEGAPEAA